MTQKNLLADGLPVYKVWKNVPEHLVSKTNARRLGYIVTGDTPVAAIKISRRFGRRVTIPLYNASALWGAEPLLPPSGVCARRDYVDSVRNVMTRCAKCDKSAAFSVSAARELFKTTGGLCMTCHEESLQDKFRREAITWAGKVASMHHEYVFVDVETTGVRVPSYDEVISLGVCDPKGKYIFHEYFKPVVQVSSGALERHGRTDDFLAGMTPITGWWDTIKRVIGQRKIIAYNLDFDRRALEGTAMRYGLGTTDWRWDECAMIHTSSVIGEWSEYHEDFKWVKLNDAASHFGIKQRRVHDAIHDAKTAAKIVQRIAELP